MAFTNKQSNFQSSIDKSKIFYQSWTKPKANRVLILQHGFGEHSDRYGNIIEKLKDDNFNIYALDARGHGRSDGKRGHVAQFQYYIEDLTELIYIARQEQKLNKVTLLGHSLGGVIALQYSLEGFNQDNLDGMILSSPGLRPKMDFEKEVKKVMAELLASFMPDMTIDANLDLNYLSHDKSVIEAYKNDRLTHGKISFQMATNLFHLSKALYEKASHLHIPVLIVHGEQDGIADVNGSRDLFRYLTTEKKIIKTYPGLYHELMNELPKDREMVLNEIKDFLHSIG
ncbi:MAG TPA: lysophospholipase [Leptospiraceae bacterium]|nr:alpha/beta hydrolase [Leptospiraceae bacterium]HMW05954.1 alpha/beta hydrolase [Leptospiraceae bacterium]HMX32114.1 alpha/beta hydrolase [Leptospiraceae bacterium]HMY32308.1 lysophospholipase [Leptospiraceae bacterium]HMZ62490.1 lysophospholipase [Leptospiraceae bacterium]